MYALMVLLSILSSLLIRDITEKGKWGARVAFFAITLVGILTHYVYAGMVAAQTTLPVLGVPDKSRA